MSPHPKGPAALRFTRRALASRLAAFAAAIGPGAGLAARGAAAAPQSVAASPVCDADLRDAALRGLALAWHRGDPVAAAAADAALARLEETDPEGAALCRLYRALDVRPAAWWQDDGLPEAAATDLAMLHGAIRDCRPVGFGYTDLSDQTSERDVLPLALVHPAQGVKLLGWCLKAQDYRQFFVRSMHSLTERPGGFTDRRLALLQGLVAQKGA